MTGNSILYYPRKYSYLSNIKWVLKQFMNTNNVIIGIYALLIA